MPPKKSDNTNYYEILGVSKNASQDDLLNAYSKAAIMHDPAKGGDLDKLMVASHAYYTLSNPENREIYDQYGEPARKDDVALLLIVSLEDLYNGTSKNPEASRIAMCSKCKGKGYKSCASMRCSGCRGLGIKVMKLVTGNLGPPMIQVPYPCYQCTGTGDYIIESTINDDDRCEQCKGDRILVEKKVFEVHVEKGMQSGQKITLPTEVVPFGTVDFIFILEQEEHPKFKRKGDDLFVKHTLSLTEALFGFQFVLTHLDNRQLIIKSKPGEVVMPGQFKEINDEGMSMYQRPSMRGKLYIHFTVEGPDALPDQCKVIEAVLARRPPSPQLADKEVDDEGEETTLHDNHNKKSSICRTLQLHKLLVLIGTLIIIVSCYAKIWGRL